VGNHAQPLDGGSLPKGNTMLKKLRAFRDDERGVTAIEYALIAGGVAVAIISTVDALGTSLKTTFSTVSTALTP
jgi:pilus assembly protein Flp/PilA